MKKIDLTIIIVMSVLACIFLGTIGLAFGSGVQRYSKYGGMFAQKPVLSRESGFYEEPFLLEITVSGGGRVYYTLDGSLPTTESQIYSEPIEITYGGGQEAGAIYVPNMQLDWQNGGGESHARQATVFRAMAVYGDGQTSDVVTATYFIGMEEQKKENVISLVADPEDLFGENGIYVTGKEYDDWYLGEREGYAPTANFMKRGKEWERPAVMELFQEESILQQPVGIRIQGASAREYGNKRFSVYARKEYSGSSWFDIPIFDNGRVHSIVLRSGFMNGYIQHLVQDRDVASADSKEVIVYLNGAEWYVTIAQEKYSRKYFQEKYGVDDDNVIIIKAGAVEAGEDGDLELYHALYGFLNSHDMSAEEAYEELDCIMDIQSYIDFSCVNVYFANLDYNESKNCVCWRVREPGRGQYEDGRWRWALYDMDLENLDYGVLMEDINTFTMDTHYAGGAFRNRAMYAALRQNPVFCRQFVLSFMDMVNTDFTVKRATEAMEDWGIVMERWGMYPDWMENFFPARTKAVTTYLAEEFELEGTMETVTLSLDDADAGIITLNTIEPDMSEGEWQGFYFTDYPITIAAEEKKGYRFVEWRFGDSSAEPCKDRKMTVEIPEGGLEIKAVFEKK